MRLGRRTRPLNRGSRDMADLIFGVLGLGLFAAFGLYARLLRSI
jgi:hypothetical protein